MYKIDRMFIAPVSHQCHMIWLYFCAPFTLKGKQEKYMRNPIVWMGKPGVSSHLCKKKNSCSEINYPRLTVNHDLCGTPALIAKGEKKIKLYIYVYIFKTPGTKSFSLSLIWRHAEQNKLTVFCCSTMAASKLRN